LDAGQKVLELQSGLKLPYDKLVLATGTRARTLPSIPKGIENVHFLRTAKDALALRSEFSHLSEFTLIGGGFIGLELAATFNALGKKVTVLEVAPRLLARSISPHLSSHVLQTHLNAGVDIRLEAQIKGFEFEGNRLKRIELEGEHIETECVLLGIGAVAEETLALQAGLKCAQGVVVDEHLRTSDPNIWAIGDCTRFTYHASGESLRLESIQNANDQARVAAMNLCGQAAQYQPTPWFWSEQGGMRLQMVGLYEPELTQVVRAGANPQSFSLFHYKAQTLQCVESVNSPMDHMMAKKMFEQKVSPSAHEVGDVSVALKSLVS
jgi:3-phenylpropionate/trans-cinnamate dioxygenase ferredoxin reductase subunit